MSYDGNIFSNKWRMHKNGSHGSQFAATVTTYNTGFAKQRVNCGIAVGQRTGM
jgi:hypothetical protein